MGSSLSLFQGLFKTQATAQQSPMIRPTTSLRSAASKARTRNSYTAPKPAPPPPAPTPLSNRLPSHPTPFTRPEPPLVAAAKAKTVKQRNVWESYLGASLSPLPRARAHRAQCSTRRRACISRSGLWRLRRLGCIWGTSWCRRVRRRRSRGGRRCSERSHEAWLEVS